MNLSKFLEFEIKTKFPITNSHAQIKKYLVPGFHNYLNRLSRGRLKRFLMNSYFGGSIYSFKNELHKDIFLGLNAELKVQLLQLFNEDEKKIEKYYGLNLEHYINDNQLFLG